MVHFGLLDADPADQNQADPSGSKTLDVTYGIYATEGCESC